ncbi:hypothetical protein [Culturomica sp.]|uniref:hypothetical protein n=1 Tax=Culturomica sp. TaxID=1926652 RepID=UPI000E98D217|nr:hypothetical protein [Culturomica sp.]HBO28146.1 hypothetical protein [Culturomica sp.]
MKETLELRINYDYAHFLFKADEGQNIGTSVKVVELSKEDSRYRQVPIIAEEVRKKYNGKFFFGWKIGRKYSRRELDTAILLHLKIKTIFEPTGEECGTLYDETAACTICGANRKQVSPLILEKGTMPKKDIAKTIGGEVVVSEKFVNAVKRRNLKGLQFGAVNVEKYYQLTANTDIELSPNTIVGINPFDLSTSNEGEIYKCPKGDTIGLNLLSEPYVLNSQSIGKYDFYASRQKVGVRRGLLRPEPIYFCSPAFRKMVEEEKLSGFEFEITNIE